MLHGYSKYTHVVPLLGWKGMFCQADACTVLPAEQWALMEHSRDAQHHECPLWASRRYNTGLLISHWITFTLSTNLFCHTIYRSKVQHVVEQRGVAKGFFTYSAVTCASEKNCSCCCTIWIICMEKECWEELWLCTLLVKIQWHWWYLLDFCLERNKSISFLQLLVIFLLHHTYSTVTYSSGHTENNTGWTV